MRVSVEGGRIGEGRGIANLRAQECVDRYKRFLSLLSDVPVHIPKFHLYMHILSRSRWCGNPRCYSTWWDEHCNKLLKGVLAGCSQLTFEQTALAKTAEALRRKRPLE